MAGGDCLVCEPPKGKEDHFLHWSGRSWSWVELELGIV